MNIYEFVGENHLLLNEENDSLKKKLLLLSRKFPNSGNSVLAEHYLGKKKKKNYLFLYISYQKDDKKIKEE